MWNITVKANQRRCFTLSSLPTAGATALGTVGSVIEKSAGEKAQPSDLWGMSYIGPGEEEYEFSPVSSGMATPAATSSSN